MSATAALNTSQVLEMFGADIGGLSTKHVLKIMAEADNNDDGVIEYKEFLPIAIELIQVKIGGTWAAPA